MLTRTSAGMRGRSVVFLNAAFSRILGVEMVRPERFELPTFWFVARRSIQLS
jgi:hypothetical protein